MQKITKTKSGKFHTQVFLGKDADGKKIVKSITCNTRRECERKAAYMLEEFKDKGFTETGLTLRQACEQYLAYREHSIEVSTANRYRNTMDYAFQSLMDIPVFNITSEMLDEALVDESTRPCRRKAFAIVTPKTIKNDFGFIKSVLTWKKVPCIWGYRASYPKGDDSRRIYPHPGEIMKATYYYNDPEMTLAVLLALMLAYTASELRGLKPSSISDNGELIVINQTVTTVKGVHYEKPRGKNKNRLRVHHIPQRIREALVPVLEGKKEDDYLIPLTCSMIWKRWKHIEKIGGWKHFSFHRLRGVCATAAKDSGMDDKILEEHGGWSRGSAIMHDVYMQQLSGERARQTKILEDYFEEDYRKVLEGNE